MRIKETSVVRKDLQSTVIFNGWALRYLGTDDHHVQILGPGMILNLQRKVGDVADELTWDAGGALSDDTGDPGVVCLGDGAHDFVRAPEPYEWCYWYTILSWKPSPTLQMELIADATPNVSVSNEGNSEHDIVGIIESLPVGLDRPPALLPRGQGFGYVGADHHFLQAGYALGEPIIATNAEGARIVSWVSRGYMKDDEWPDSVAMDAVGAIAGKSVRSYQPATVQRWAHEAVPPQWVDEPTDFALKPRKAASVWTGDITRPTTIRERYAVNVPFSYAVPMLTGWEVGNDTYDRHLLRAGVYLEEFSFVQHASGRSGTVFYTVVSSFFDNDQDGGVEASHRVSILGIEHVLAGHHPTFPDPELGPIKPNSP